MPQRQLPIFPAGSTAITNEIAFEVREGRVFYFNGHLPVFAHDIADIASFRLFTTQLIENGTVSQGNIAKVFGISLTTIKRCVKRYREKGPEAFYVSGPRRKGKKLTPERLLEVQELLNQGESVPAASTRVGILANTIHKAIDDGRLQKSSQAEKTVELYPLIGDSEGGSETNTVAIAGVTTKSERSQADVEGVFGMATLRGMERVAAAIGLIEAAPLQFEPADDVPNGGVLLALPALIELGLLRHTLDSFSLPKGFYPIESIFIVLALLALARVRSLESLRYQAPGEWGKLIGLDRIPEVKTLRQKLTLLCKEPGRVKRWSSTLAKTWMEAAPHAAGTIYIDGHVRAYHGYLTKLPRRYVARERLFLRGTTDYWANAMDGQPFFVVTKPVDPGLLTVLREDIVPRLKSDIPGQPTSADLEANSYLHRFTLVFDRAGYSPDFFKEMREENIAVITYHKFPGDLWSDFEFQKHRVNLINSEEVELDLAERGTRLSNGLWVREIRHRDERGHQTSVISTDYMSALTTIAASMFARWCQENFFKYMLEHYGLDRLIEYGTEPLPDTTKVVNPSWRKLDGEVRKTAAILAKDRARFGALHLSTDVSPEESEQYELNKGQILQSIQEHQQKLETLKDQRKSTPKHVIIKDLPEKDQFSQLQSDKKQMIDTIKLIAYRAETTLVNIARQTLARFDDARSLVHGVLMSSVDLRPDYNANTLTIRLHHQATLSHNDVLKNICEELTETETTFPGTNLRMVFEQIGSS